MIYPWLLAYPYFLEVWAYLWSNNYYNWFGQILRQIEWAWTDLFHYLYSSVLPLLGVILLSQDSRLRLNPLGVLTDLVLVFSVCFSDLILTQVTDDQPKYSLLVPLAIVAVQTLNLAERFYTYEIVKPVDYIDLKGWLPRDMNATVLTKVGYVLFGMMPAFAFSWMQVLKNHDYIE